MQPKVLLSIGASFVFLIAVTISSFSETNTMEYTFCVNSKTKVVTYSKSGKCPKGNEPIQVGAKGLQGLQGDKGDVGPQGMVGPKGEAAVTSFNLLLRDANGQLVQDLVGDGSVYRDGRYWSLDYETGKFTPLVSYFYTGFFDELCKDDPVALLYARVPSSADRELRQLREQTYNIFVYYTGEIPTLGPFYEITSGARIIDNRDTTEGSEFPEIKLKRPIYTTWDQNDSCYLNNEAFFYIDGLAKMEIKIPEPLPAPIRWSRN